ncbi:MAG: DUF1905 domain-containing protein [Flavobacteriaceae bacterium]|nr:MAG: DUF1905 domain-containing protein [Flavobacteriaceae bacterium]
MESRIKYEISAKLWRHGSEGGWHFITLPKEVSKEIRDHLQWQEEGWGRMKASAIIKEIQWKTSIWFDTKLDSYILPVKSEIRSKLFLKTDDLLDVIVLV